MNRGAEAESILSGELTCPVCLDTYRDPVSLGCGHCFCRQCITDSLTVQKAQRRAYTCPMCQAQYEEFPNLLRNLQLCNIVQNYNSTQSNKDISSMVETCNSIQGENTEDSSIIPCSYCLDVPNRAVKTCLQCEVSLCQQHLERHSKKSHILLEPTEYLEERKCSVHDKLLEYYCAQDESCICVICYIAGSHRGHSIMTLKEAHEKKMSLLSQTTKSLSSSVDTICKDIDDLQAGLVKVKQNTAKLSKPLEDLCKEIISQVGSQFEEIVNTITTNEVKSVSQITAVTKQMEENKGNVVQIIEELNTLSEQPDDLLFLKDFMRVQALVKQQNLQINTLQVLDLETDQKMTKAIQDDTADYISNLGHILKHVHTVLAVQAQPLVWSGGQRSKVISLVQPVFDAGRQMILQFSQSLYTHCNYNMLVSNNNKTVTVTAFTQAITNIPFGIGYHNYGYNQVQSNQVQCNCKLSIIVHDNITRGTFSSKVYCLMDVSKSTNWCVGVTNNASTWYLMCEESALSFKSDTALFLGTYKINTLKMQLDFDANVLGFYDASSVKEMPLLVCQCCKAFQSPINVGVGVLNGSLTLL